MAKLPKVANIGLYNWIRNSGLTQTEVALVCGVTKQAISNIIVLGYMPSAKTLHNLCANYGLEYNEVFCWCAEGKENARRNNSNNDSNNAAAGQLTFFV